MNKKLVAVAIAGLLAAPLAQAQTANVTLYGRINIDMEFVNGRLANNTNPNVYRVASNSSRFGLRGTESLGGGLNAIFQIENGSIRPTTGDGGNLAGRDSFVGLSGGWGTFKMGRYLAPYDDIHGIFGNDNTASTSILSTASVWAQGFAGQPITGGFDDRLQQSIRYDTPSCSGFKFEAQFSTTGGTSGPTNANFPSSNTQRPVLRPVLQKRPVGHRRRVRVPPQPARHVRRRNCPLSDWAFSVAAKWQFSSFNIAGVYEKMEYEVLNGLARWPILSGNKLKRNSFWAVDTTINVGANGQVFLYWGKASRRHAAARPTRRNRSSPPNAVVSSNISRVAGLAKGANTGATHWEISYSYDLSKRTRVYTGYVKINNDANASYNFNINAYPGSANTVAGGPVGMKRQRLRDGHVPQLLIEGVAHPALAGKARQTGAFGRPFFFALAECTACEARVPIARRHCDIMRERRISLRTKLVAVVVAGLLTAPIARAQEASVTLYGRINVYMEIVNGKQSGPGCPDHCPNPNVYRVTSNSSEFGIRGAEPLGNGISAIFQIENSISVTQGRGVLTGRDSFVGFYGPLGSSRWATSSDPTTTSCRSSATSRR